MKCSRSLWDSVCCKNCVSVMLSISFDKIANWKQDGIFSSRSDEDESSSTGFDMSIFKTLRYNTVRQKLINDTADYGNNLIQVVIKHRSGYVIEVTKLLEHFLEYCSHAVFSYKLKVCKECARKPNRV